MGAGVRGLLVGAVLAGAMSAMISAAAAEGAMAVGTSGNFAKDGFAFGAAVNKASKDDARDQAVATCRKFEAAPKMAAICRVLSTFTRECYALSFDPKPGTPGVGWAIASDKDTAEERAQAACEATAGAARRGSCKVNQSACDTQE